MMYQIRITGSRNLIVSKLPNVARPITCYFEKQIEPNTVYCVVTTVTTPDSQKVVHLKLLDMNVREGIRDVFPTVTIYPYDLEEKNPKFKYKIFIETNLGSFNDNRPDVSDPLSSAGKKIMKKIWTKGIPLFFDILKKVEEYYASEKTVSHTAWLSKLPKEHAQAVKEFISLKLGA